MATGLIQMTVSILAYPDKGYFWDFPVPAWGEAILFFVGLCITIISIRASLRGEGKFKKPKVNEEEIVRARATLERMYLKEHGQLPEYPPEGQSEDSAEAQSPTTGADEAERKN